MATTTSSSSRRPGSAGALRSLAVSIAIGGLFACSASTPALADAEAASPACSLYASSSGSDSNPGTAAAPVQSVKRLIGELAAGQTGCLASGETFSGFTLYAGNSHGAEGAPVTITSTNPNVPATIDTRVTTTAGVDWLTFTHLILKSDVLSSTEEPSPTINSAHTSWTYDDISGGDMNICILPSQPTEYGAAEYTLIEHDRVHDCGHAVTAVEEETEGENDDHFAGRLNGWHAHGIYDEGFHTTIRNSYFYENSSKGILLRGGSYAVVEHNIVDHNGSGVLFGDNGPNHDVVAWNIVSNSTSPCGRETGWCDDFGVWSYCQRGCAANSFVNNDVFGNADGNIAPSYDLCSCIEVRSNIEADPLYVNAAAHNYALQSRSPALGYGPDTAQPAGAAVGAGQTTRPSEPARRFSRRHARARAAHARTHRHHKAKRAKRRHVKPAHARKHRRTAAGRRAHGKR